MKLEQVQTPAILVDRGIMEGNLKTYQQACDQYGKQLWPMVKTHKSTQLALLQQQLGAAGFLCGTLDECEALCEAGINRLMYAYPLAGEVSCRRAARLAQACEFYARVDDLDGAAMLDRAAAELGVTISCTIIVDCGLHRFGVKPEGVLAFARALGGFGNLALVGISTHPGHVYGEGDAEKVSEYVQQELQAIHTAVEQLEQGGYPVKLVTTGSTPTFRGAVSDPVVGVYHPGNYIFHDCIQISNNTAGEEDCALTVYATVISHPAQDLFLCDAGAKCLGLDQGAHGNSSVRGHGRVVGHPELTVAGLSEEVGKLKVSGPTDLKVGERIRIIPNHACSAANLTDWYLMVEETGEIGAVVPVDVRGNRTPKGVE